SKVSLSSTYAEFAPKFYVLHKVIRRLLSPNPINIVAKLRSVRKGYRPSSHNPIYWQSNGRVPKYNFRPPFGQILHRTYPWLLFLELLRFQHLAGYIRLRP